MENGKVIVRLKGGLGNQLFCYAAARRLALVNDASLVIDDVSGFIRDKQYSRRYSLDQFRIEARKARPAERLEPFERYRRALLKWRSRSKPFSQRRYVEQEGLDFDERLLSLKVSGSLYLDGLWQGEGYFKDIETVIRNDLQIRPPGDSANQSIAERIRSENAVALHVRWFDGPASLDGQHNLSVDYYHRAIEMINQKVEAPVYFVFSDNPSAAYEKLALSKFRTVMVENNKLESASYADLWLMSQCAHFITANSTFSWWGAWLGRRKGKLVMSPKQRLDGKTAWGFKGLIPPDWVQI